MKRLLLIALLAASAARADYAAWLEFAPSFKPRDYEEGSTMEIEWGPSVDWPQTTPRLIRLPNALPAESRERLLGYFGKGPWGVLERANDGKGYMVFTRSPEQDFPGEGEPRILSVAEREAKARDILASIGYPVESLARRKGNEWVQSEGKPGAETDTVAGLGLSCTIGGLRLLAASAYEASLGFDRHQRLFEFRLVWRRTRPDGEFTLVTRERAGEAIKAGKARTYSFGYGGQLGTTLSRAEADAYKQAVAEARERRERGLPPAPGPAVARTVNVRSAELVLLDYAGAEGPDGTERAQFGRFDDILWPMLVLSVDLVTDGKTERGELMLPADAAWFREEDKPPGSCVRQVQQKWPDGSVIGETKMF